MGIELKHIVITGASSGIGEALALAYAGPGVHLGLTGRNQERLAGVKALCEEKGARVETAVLDVTDKAAMAAWLSERDAAQPVDLVIANAGISGGTFGMAGGEPAEQVEALFSVNVGGVFNTINPLIPRMIERGCGHIAIMSSLAGFRGFPSAPGYGASKAAVRIYGEGLRGALHKTGVNVHVICPGFVKSRMTDANDFSMPFLMEAEKAAQTIQAGIAKNKGRIAFPWPMFLTLWIFAALPDWLMQKILVYLPKKRALERK